MVYPRRVTRRYGRRQIQAVVRGMAEKKFLSQAFSTNESSPDFLNEAGVLFDLSPIPQDATDSGRIGDKVTLNSVECRWSCQSSGETTLQVRYIWRMIIFTWKDDSTPGLTDILQNTGLGPEATVLQPFDHDKKIKRKIHYDEVFVQYSDLSDSSHPVQNPIRTGKCVLNLANLRNRLNTIEYQSGSTTGVNKLYCFVLNNIPLGSDQNTCWNHVWVWRLNYIDV